MFGFNTMPANNGKGGTYLIVKMQIMISKL